MMGSTRRRGRSDTRHDSAFPTASKSPLQVHPQIRSLWVALLLWVSVVEMVPPFENGISCTVNARRSPWVVPASFQRRRRRHNFAPSVAKRRWKEEGKQKPLPLLSIRGGGSDEAIISGNNDDDDDDERYSRQVYTLGARAHSLVRSSCVIVDGPLESGLLWECLKNLALSGIGNIILLVDDNDNDDESSQNDKAYHDATMDDLGKMYIRGARAEIEDSSQDREAATEIPLPVLSVEFLRRLNPSLQASTMSRKEFAKNSLQSSNFQDTEGNGKTIFLCVDRPYALQEAWNELCRNGGDSSSSWPMVPFVAVETAGVYGRIFCDFGAKHEVYDSDGESLAEVPLDRVEPLEETENTIVIKAVDGERHDVSKDDYITFQRSDGSSIDEDCVCRVTNVISPERIQVAVECYGSDFSDLGSFLEHLALHAVTFSRQKQIQTLEFLPLKEANSRIEELLTPCDLDKSFDATRRDAVLKCFEILNDFVVRHKHLPITAKEMEDETILERSEEWKQHSRKFFQTCRAKFVPLQAVFGAIAAQECLKAASGLYNPIHQFLLYDCDEILGGAFEGKSSPDRSSLAQILGGDTLMRLQNQKVFVVGSGAIGCEIVKNLAAMGAGTGESGAVIVTDMDTIEKSNLSRQLLFRDSDIGKFKSKAAQEAIRRLNPDVKMVCHTSKVGDDSEAGPFDSKFWASGIDTILNALDNMDARLFMDAQCVANEKALVDAGTLGSKGNVQVVVPHQSESYGSSVDPPEPAIPVCTLKNFPYAISHTIQWGRDLFDGLFVRRPNQANKYAPVLVEKGFDVFVETVQKELGDQAALEIASELSEDVVFSVRTAQLSETEVKEQAVQWAIKLAKQLFYDAIEALLREHPPDSVDEDGEKFWSGSRKLPRTLSYHVANTNGFLQQSDINSNLVEFVRSAARLRYESIMGIPSSSKENTARIPRGDAESSLASDSMWETKKIPPEGDDQTKDSSSGPIELEIRKKLAPLETISKIQETSICELFTAEFEKDDDSNDHIAFITAASNLRAISYGIPPVDAMETRKVAGRIVPAMITTTAVVSALSCIEFVKLCIHDMTLQRHRNAFINLALPFFAFTSPLPAEEYPGLRGKTHTMWDRITVKEGKKAAQAGGLTVRRLLRKISKKVYKTDPDVVSISNISVGPYMIYANFLHEDDEELLDKSVWDVINEAVAEGDAFDQNFSRDDSDKEPVRASTTDAFEAGSYIDLTVTVEDLETGDEVELPPVRVVKTSSS